MTLGLAFWVLMLVWAVFACAWNWPGNPVGPYGPIGNTILIFVLFLILGWHDFGPPIHG